MDRQLKRLKYALLLVILAAACSSVRWTDRLVELEPFKTSITLNFVRAWPFVLWALAGVVSSLWVYKGYCRYVCPLGAAMALLGRLRRFDWIARRVECGAPCQRCRSACAYQAIEKTGRIDYVECFQCLDCVVIHASPTLCVPVFNAQRKGRTIVIASMDPIDVDTVPGSLV
jgi:polyferredoxin